MKSRYYIRVGTPWQETLAPDGGSHWGWSFSLDRAIARAQKLTRAIRTDCPVYVTDETTIYAQCGVNSGPGGVSERSMIRS